MSCRRKTANRLTLFRECAICGQNIVTTADTPWMRQMPMGDKKQAICYFCSSECFKASYKHIGCYDGKYFERKKERDANRDPAKRAEYFRRYYAEHGAEIREKKRIWYWENREEAMENMRYQRKKKRMLENERAKLPQ